MKRDALDELLDGIGPAGPDEGPDDLRWEQLALGALSAPEAARLRAMAATSPEASALLDLYDPLEDELIDDIAARVVAARPAEPAPYVAPAARWVAPEVERPPVRPAEVPPPDGGWLDRVLRLFARPVVLAPTLLVATLLLVVGPMLRTPALPSYEADLLSGDATVRSEVTAGRAHAPGSVVQVRLAPSAPGAVAVEADAVLEVGGVRLPLPVTVEASPEGVLLVRGRVPEDATLPAGPATLRLALRPAGGAVAREVAVELELTGAR